MQLESGPSDTGTGGPKKQRASRSHAPATTLPGQLVSAAHAPMPSVPVEPLRQWRPGPAPSVQSAGPEPGSAPSVSATPTIDTPVTASTDLPPSGIAAPGKTAPRPPPK